MKIYCLKNIVDDREAIIQCKIGFQSDAELHGYALEKELFGAGVSNLSLETKEMESEEYLRYMVDKIIAGIDEKLEDMKYDFENIGFDELTVEEIDHECRRFSSVYSIRSVFHDEHCSRFNCKVLEHWLTHTDDMIERMSEAVFDMRCSDDSIDICDLINQG